MNTTADLVPGIGERQLIVGLAGSGKTNVAQWILDSTPEPQLIIDPKREWKGEGYNRIVRPIEIRWQMAYGNFPILYQPNKDDFSDLKVYDDIFRHIFNRGKPIRVYIDEIVVFADAMRYPRHLKICCMQGRSKGIGITTCTQNPSNIPRCTYTETQSFCAFYLNAKEDRRKVNAMVRGYDAEDLARYEFFHYRIDQDTPAAKFKVPEFMGSQSMAS